MPRLRIWKWPIRAVASASSRTRSRTAELPPIAACVVIAPTPVTPSASVT